MKIIHRKSFGLAGDPWRGLHTLTADGKAVRELVLDAWFGCHFISILGPRGAGKTYAVRRELAGIDEGLQVVEPVRLTRDRLHMGDIEDAIIRDLSDETPRRSGEARSRQVRRVLGEATRTRKVLLVIDDSHVLRPQTLRALKRLRELAWAGRSPLLGILLIGQRDTAGAIPEIGLRSDFYRMAGLTREEACNALRMACKAVLDKDAAEALAADSRARNWLDLQALLDDCLAEALARGERRVTRAVAEAVITPAAPDVAPASRASDDDAVARALDGHAGLPRAAVA